MVLSWIRRLNINFMFLLDIEVLVSVVLRACLMFSFKWLKANISGRN